ncbi:hypothetical protein POM88_000514 [Heracleum sosnowskyi]|uniref:Uncharacterized protein n=1 Tax=Heracleum sosnowskyi TaxID=360622 RepID=A0AAD8N8T2_9APIA|nr:hypothetical protein POM88_000514 [Heracleum sosnowskyi]
MEAFGCQALVVANANFQGVLHQAKASLETMKADYSSQKQMMAEKDEQLAIAHAELVALRAKKEEIIDDYMDGQEFQKLMEDHDESLFPCQFTQGWNEALDSVVKAHPGMFLPRDFPSPHPPALVAAAGNFSQSDDEMDDVGDNRILDPIHHSPPFHTSQVASLEEEDDASGSGSEAEESGSEEEESSSGDEENPPVSGAK